MAGEMTGETKQPESKPEVVDPAAPGDARLRRIVDEGKTERERLVGRAGIVGAGTLLSRVLGFGRDVVTAALFTRYETDAFAAALTIPNALRQLLAEGAVSSAVVPVLSERLANGGDEEAKKFFAKAHGVSLVALVVVSVLGIVFAGPLAKLFASGFEETPGKLELTTGLTRVMFPYIFFMGVAALGMAALNAKREFGVAAFAPALFNVAIIGSAFVLREPLAARGVDPVMALALGVLIGGALQVMAQTPALRAIGYATRPRLDLRDPHVRKMLGRVLPMVFGLGIYYVDLVLSRRFLSELGEGPQTYFFFASRLCDFPQGIFVMAISTAAVPSLATFAAKGDHVELLKTWANGMRLSLFVAVPCSVALAVMGEPIVALLFEHGKFDAASTEQTARALVWQGAAIFTVAAARQLVPAFHVLGDTRTPVIVSALDLLAFIGLALGLRGSMGHVGISVAVAGSSAVQMLLLFAALRMKLGSIRGGDLLASLARVVAASVVGGGGGWATSRILATEGRILPGLGGGVAFSVLFVVAAWAFGARELSEIAAPIRRRLARRVPAC